MESKKLQQLQQANLHLAPQKKTLNYQTTNLTDYRTAAHSPIFHQQSHHSHQSQQHTPATGGAIDIQPQGKHLVKPNALSAIGGSPYHQQYSGGVGGGEQIYQSPSDRTYQMSISGRPPPTAVQPANPVTALQHQYQQLQQAKIQAQIQTQNESMAHQQRTFALRQKMNPPIPQSYYHMSQSASVMSSATISGTAPAGSMQNQQMSNQSHGPLGPQRSAPPSTLNLSTQFHPAAGPLKIGKQQQTLNHEHNIYAQQQHQLQLQLQLQQQQQHLQQQQISGHHLQDSSQVLKHQMKSEITAPTPGSEHSPVYIQQNHPGHVVNQACQTQLSGSGMTKASAAAATASKTPSSEDSATKSPSHQPLDRKKSSGSMQALKSPITKRPLSTQVTLSGWLYKQGSDGLKVWRKRWFVLAEYCLYYYKGPEEEKLLGSILLPSYRVSACLPEDKIYRKYAFKCEHTNMRTYWLAAETGESMIQWVRALSAATMMQATSNSGESDQASQPSVSSSLNHSGENSDSGIHTLQSQQSKISLSQGPVTPASDNGVTALTNASSGGSGQPLYANAPPKPRRINDGGYSSPSPEHSSLDNDRKAQQQQQQQQQHGGQHGHYAQQQQFLPSRRGVLMSPTLQQMQRSQQHAIYDTRTGNVSSILRLQHNPMDNLDDKFQEQMALCNSIADEYNKSATTSQYMDMEKQILRLQQQQQQQQQRDPVEDIYGERELYMQKVIQQRYPPNQHMSGYMNAERRTPDAYGRSKNRPFSDYEDIYNLTQGLTGGPEVMLPGSSTAAGYRRPLSPPVYDTSKHVPSMPSRYTPNHLEPSTAAVANVPATSGGSLRVRPSASIVRPHSADFLEYEARAEAEAATATISATKPDTIRAPRPKSSLDINRTPDSFYYSEASYAEKMRKSALYLQNPQSQHQQSSSVSSVPAAACTQQHQQQPAATLGCIAGRQTDFNSSHETTANNGMNTIGYENPYERAHKRNELLSEALNSKGASSIPRMSRSVGGVGVCTGGGLASPVAISHSRSASHHHSKVLPQSYSSSFQQQQQLQSPASPSGHQQQQQLQHQQQQQQQQHEQFLRSASARLPKRGICGIDDENAVSSYNNMSPTSPPPPAPSSATLVTSASLQDGERKREESMKRLLEWKQRMLQSPLTRKGALQHSASSTSAMVKLGSNPNILLSSTGVNSTGNQLAQQQIHNNQNAAAAVASSSSLSHSIVSRGIQRSRSETHANATGYNSYSSDDEDGPDKPPAGRSTPTPTPTSSNATIAFVDTQIQFSNNSLNNSNIKKKIHIHSIAKSNTIHRNHKMQNYSKQIQNPSETENNNNLPIGVSLTSTTLSSLSASASPSPLPQTLPLSGTLSMTSLSAVQLMSTTNLTQKNCNYDITANNHRSNILRTNTSSPHRDNKTNEETKNISCQKHSPDSPVQIDNASLKIPFYIPVYKPKILVGSSMKDYETGEINQKFELNSNESPIDTAIATSTSDAELKMITKCEEETDKAQNQPSDEDEEDNTACEYTDDDLEEALAEEGDEIQSNDNEVKIEKVDKQQARIPVYENETEMLPIEVLSENHYLPMNPKKTVLSPCDNLSFSNQNDCTVDEENPYVEMTKGLEDDTRSMHYEAVCVATSVLALATKSKQNQILAEPVYMELAQNQLVSSELSISSGKLNLKKSALSKKNCEIVKKKSKKMSERGHQSKRKDLPDILKPSQSTVNVSSDSSDADDESSKNVDTKKMRSRSRFSLSDTFRPASYYLGASTPLTNCAESSDSEIVSPPPIPSSPPPIEELNTEEIFSSEHYDTVKRRDSSSGSKFNLSYDQIPKIHSSNSSLNIAKSELAFKSSRLSLPDQFTKIRGGGGGSGGSLKTPPILNHHHERTLSDSNYSFQTDTNSSNTSSDFDLYNKLKNNSPSFVPNTVGRYQSPNSLQQKYNATVCAGGGDSSETDSVEYRQRQGSDSELEKQRSRRPLSEESISEIESMSEQFEETLTTTDLDAYLNQLQISDLDLYQNSSVADATSNALLNESVAGAGCGDGGGGGGGATIIMNLIKPPEIFRNKDDEHFYGNIHFVSSTDSLQKIGSDPKEFISEGEGSITLSLLKEKNLFIHDAQCATDDISESIKTDIANSTTLSSIDLDQRSFCTAFDLTQNTPIHSRNNSNISEHSVPYYYSELSSSRELIDSQIPLNNQRDITSLGSYPAATANISHIHNPIERKSTGRENILLRSPRSLSVEILTEKDQTIDSKNLYKVKTNIEKLSYCSEKNLKASIPSIPFVDGGGDVASVDSTTDYQDCSHSSNLENQQKLSNFQPLSHAHAPSTSSSSPNASLLLGAISSKDTNIDPGSGCSPTDSFLTSSTTVIGGSSIVSGNNNQSTSSTANNQSNFSDLSAGERLWEEDALWRESLRRVSQRHARSLDDLDRIHQSNSSVRISPAIPSKDQHHNKQPTVKSNKISRDVTYVNGNISAHARSTFKPRSSEPPKIEQTSQWQMQEAADEGEELDPMTTMVVVVVEDQEDANNKKIESQTTDEDRTSDNDIYVQLATVPPPHISGASDDVYEVLREDSGGSNNSRKSIEIDRETIRQWDSMSSGLMKNSANKAKNDIAQLKEQIEDKLNSSNKTTEPETSISVRNVGNLPPKGNLTVKPEPSDHHHHHRQHLNYDQISKMTNSYYGTAHDTKYAKTTSLMTTTADQTNNMNGFYSPNAIINSIPVQENSIACGTLNGSIYDINAATSANYRESNGGGYPMRRAGSRAEIDLLERETSTQMRNLDVSAGDLLSRTHEELVLLLIQLRRQNSNTARAIEQCCTDIHEIQNRIRTSEGLTRAESIQRLDYLKQHLLDLERQYEKSKPLVNLVDNMVKLGSLYRNNNESITESGRQRQESVTLDRLEFNQRIQERRLLQEEQKQWDRLSPNHTELQSKVRQLYQLDQLLQEESGTLQNLQRDKEDLERALGGLRARIQDTNGPSLALDAAKKQQHILERELSRVHQLLAENSKKLEQTVAGNARLEQELLVLRQKLQASRSNRGSQSALNMVGGNEGMQYVNTTTAMLESELKRVQQLVGDMQRQRQELSSAVRQLTENSNRLYQEIGNKENSGSGSGSSSSHIKKRNSSSCWIETDLDSMLSIDKTVYDSVSSNLSTPLFVDTSSNVSNNIPNCSTVAGDDHIISSSSKHHSRNRPSYSRYNDSDGVETSGVDSDGFLETNPFVSLTNQEKQEIKTVRIVKRESERRHRDRERNVTNSTQNLDLVLEEDNHQTHHNMAYMNDDFPARSKSLPRQYNEPPKPRMHKYSFNGSSGDTHIATSKATHQHQNGGRYSNHPTNSKYEYYANGNYSNLTNGKDNCYQQQQSHTYSKQSQMTPLANAYFANPNHIASNGGGRKTSDSAPVRNKTESMQSLTKSITDLSSGPVFQSAAAKQIINEMSAGSASEDNAVNEKVPPSHKHRRAVPREKRRHYTAPNNFNIKAMENIQAENDMNRNNTNWRARDDLDMEVALRPRMNAPDVVRSALGQGEKISENTIDNLLLAPNKIVIPERYIPEKTPELSPEEKKRRQEKVEVIKKMLSEAPINTSNDTISLPPSKLSAEKKQREHLLQLNQILAQQVMQMSKIVAEKAMAKQKVSDMNNSSVTSEEDRSSSPTDSLPLYQQRDNFFT